MCLFCNSLGRNSTANCFLFVVLAHSLVNSAMLETKTEQAAADSKQRIAECRARDNVGTRTLLSTSPSRHSALSPTETWERRKAWPWSLASTLWQWPFASLRLLSSRLIDAPWNPFDQYLAPHYVTKPCQRKTLCHIQQIWFFFVILTLCFCNLSKECAQ